MRPPGRNEVVLHAPRGPPPAPPARVSDRARDRGALRSEPDRARRELSRRGAGAPSPPETPLRHLRARPAARRAVLAALAPARSPGESPAAPAPARPRAPTRSRALRPRPDPTPPSGLLRSLRLDAPRL